MPRPSSFALPGVLLAIACLTSPAFAGWGPDGATIRSTAATIPMVAACSDGGTGTFVAWHETSSSPAGTLRVQHVLASGDPDPSWPVDGALATTAEVARSFIDVLPDRLGGVYVCWVEGSTLLATRLLLTGQIAAGWPATGKALGAANMSSGRPRIIEDGSHGMFVAWTVGASVLARRVGTDGQGPGGWPNGNDSVSATTPSTIKFWPGLALGPDGGIFISWGTWSTDTTVVQSGLFLRRLTSAGGNSPGWPGGGMFLAPFRPELLQSLCYAPMLAISPDARGGLFWIAGTLEDPLVDVRLHRILADGTPAAGWPAEGRAVPSFFYYYGGGGPDDGLGVHADGQDGALVELQQSYSDSPPITGLSRAEDGGQVSSLMQGVSKGHETVAEGDGGAFMADFKPQGRNGPYDYSAFLSVDQSQSPAGWAAWREQHDEPVTTWYGDIALTPTGGDGVVFFWSQVNERFGLFARRFTTAGQVTGVPPPPPPDPGPVGLNGLRFVNGRVVARITLDGTPARLDLYDAIGRRRSSRTFDMFAQGGARSSVEVELPGSEALASGLYFARMTWGQSTATGKVAVIR
jgi:hypothetical protein